MAIKPTVIYVRAWMSNCKLSPSGDTYLADDGCNTCSCTLSPRSMTLVPACTMKLCPPGCMANGRLYLPGTVFDIYPYHTQQLTLMQVLLSCCWSDNDHRKCHTNMTRSVGLYIAIQPENNRRLVVTNSFVSFIIGEFVFSLRQPSTW